MCFSNISHINTKCHHENTQKKNFTKKVQNVVRRMAETKIQDYSINEDVLISNFDTPYVQDLTQIERGGASNQRIGNEILMSGVKWRLLFHCRNNPNYEDVVIRSLWCRIAIIEMKNTGTTDVVLLEDFFRKGANSMDFDAVTEAERYYLPVDLTNKKTLYQTTFKIGVKNQVDTADYLSNKIIKNYRKVSRSINFESSDISNSASTKLYFVCWIGNNDLDANNATTNNAGACELSGLLSTYYKDF
ncbi:hypothetical protein [Circovirus-like genome BBC-A]|uniref:hypothetical protein n=1 Tax=Circovirus-like genome BBC-A TaxID=642260 RepID=UPI0001AE5DC6|nr:hypothetical protein [Circovirus-like genome BBC-A]ACQ78176.1 hypothetical protein [Circovirus-like genome BBC-A]